jgi:hypothetical protein
MATQGQAVNIYDSQGNIIYANTNLYNPSTGLYEVQRTPTKFVGASVNTTGTANLIAAWTPAAGKKCRILQITLAVSVAPTVAPNAWYSFWDGSASTSIVHMLPQAINIQEIYTFPGNGYLSVATNNIIYISGPAATTVMMFLGCEE